MSDSPIEFATTGENLDTNINLVVWTLMIKHNYHLTEESYELPIIHLVPCINALYI